MVKSHFGDRFPLYYLSRSLFDDAPTLKALFKQSGEILKPDFLPWLLWRRFSIKRSFFMPVTLLENLVGNERQQRLRVLQSDHNSAPAWLTIVFMHLEILLTNCTYCSGDDVCP